MTGVAEAIHGAFHELFIFLKYLEFAKILLIFVSSYNYVHT